MDLSHDSNGIQNDIYMQDVIYDIQVIEKDVNDVEQKWLSMMPL